MEGKTRHIFPGANTANGSFNFFTYMIPTNVKKIFCMKGGPGVGKSSMMKKIAKEFINNGYDVELHHCPSDPSSLDGIVIKKLGIVMLDGTAPHIVDPNDPGAIDEIINLGEYWNVEGLENNRKEIVDCGKSISESFQRAYKYLKAAEPIYYDIEYRYKNCMDFGKVNLATEEFIEKIFKYVESSGELKRDRHLFATAITPVGHVDYTDSVLSEAKKVYYLKGDIGIGRTTFLKKVYNKAIEKGMEVEVYHYPLIKEKLETVFIKDLRLGITTSTLFENNEAIDLEQYLDRTKLLKYEDEILVDKRILDEMINYAISNLKKAKAKHDVIESYYIPNMKFEEIDKFKDELLKRIISYEK